MSQKMHDHGILHMHCKNCFEAGIPSSQMEVVVTEEGMKVSCSNCKEIVAFIKDFEEFKNMSIRRGCDMDHN